MSDFPTTAKVVVIGGGAVGVSTLYHLAKKGWTDCVLLEKNELTAGSTWHAAGNCPNFSASWAVMNMQRYSLEMYRTLAEDVDYPINYHVTGALRLGHTKERTKEFERVASMARYQGLQMDMLEPEAAKQYYPFLETHDLDSVLWDPLDGDIDPSQLTQAMAKGARDLGANIQRFCPATGVTQNEDNTWIVHTDKGDIHADYVVNCGGYYAARIGEWFKPFGGRDVPLTVMSHQYFLTERIEDVAKFTEETGKHLPMVRDVDSSYYLRQDTHGLNLGPYERNCKAHWVTEDDPMPEDFSFQLYPDDLDRLEWYIEDAMERVPQLGTAGVGRNINGPIPYAPDGLPLMGPMPGVKNAFEAHSFTFGIVQSGGAGKCMAEWIIDGETEWDMWAVDSRRYTDHADADFCHAKALETYGHEYAMHFPHHQWPAGRNKKLSPNHERMVADGAQMGAFNGWERACWFAAEGEDTSEAGTETWLREGSWTAAVKREVEAVRDGVGVIDMCGFSRFTLKGEGAAEWLRTQVAGALPKVGRMNLVYFSDTRGRVVTEMSCIRHGDDDFTLMTAAVAQWHDYELLWRNLPAGLELTDVSKDFTTLLVTGPKSRELFAGISDADLSAGWLSLQNATVAGQPALLARVSFVGELGWEVHVPTANAAAAYAAIREAGATPFGMYALDSMRIEKGYRTWKGDLSTDYTMFEAGLGRFVRLNKEQDFPGKAALAAESEAGSKKTFVTLIVDAPNSDAPYMSTISKDGEIVGETTSGNYGYRVNASIALGVVRADLAVPGTELEINIFGETCKAVVQEDAPLWDPENERLRA